MQCLEEMINADNQLQQIHLLGLLQQFLLVAPAHGRELTDR
jgi:hypothetical protein